MLNRILIGMVLLFVLCSCGKAVADESPTANQPAMATMMVPATPQETLPPLKVGLEKNVTLTLPDAYLNYLAFTPDGTSLIAGDLGGAVYSYRREDWSPVVLKPSLAEGARDLEALMQIGGTTLLSPDGSLILAASGENGRVSALDRAGREQFNLEYGAMVYSLAISPDGRMLAIGGLNPQVTIYDLQTWESLAVLAGDHEYVTNLAFSPDGKTLVATFERPGNVLRAWDTSTWLETKTFIHNNERFDYHDLVFSPDGSRLVISTNEADEIRIVNLADWQTVATLAQHTRGVYQVAFSPDGSWMASVADDSTLRTWDARTFSWIATTRFPGETTALAFSPDGAWLAISVWGKGIEIWSISS